ARRIVSRARASRLERFARRSSSVSVNERTRIVTWQAPAPVGKEAFSMAGAAFLRAIAERKLPPPPIANLMGFDIEEVGEGRVVFGVEPQEYHYNPIGMVHGGL